MTLHRLALHTKALVMLFVLLGCATSGETNMRFMVIVKASKESEAGVLPSQEVLTEMGKFNEELVKSGVMLAGEGLQASSKGVRVRYAGSKRTVTDGPFAETKELVAGCSQRPSGELRAAEERLRTHVAEQPPKR
jgi:hypothetical protein